MKPESTERRSYGEGSLYQKSNGIWMYSMRHGDGQRVTKSLGTRDEKEAQKEYLKVRRELDAKIEHGDLAAPTVTNFTIGELLAAYLKHIQMNGKKSAYVIEKVIGKIQTDRTFNPERKVSTLSTADFEQYRDRHIETVSHSTINFRFTLIRSAMNLESKRTPSRVGKVPFIPAVNVDNVREGFLEYEDYPSLLAELPRSLKAMFVIAFHSGCRKGEVLNMKWSDVDWKNRSIRLPKTKNGTKRNLPFWGAIEEHLKAQKNYRDAHHPDCEQLFFWMAEDCQLAHGGIRVVPGSPIGDFRDSWATAVYNAHVANKNVLEGLLFHDLRRSGVRVMVQEAGIPEAQAMLISGHKTRAMLERYNIVSLKNIQDAGAKLDAWSKAQPTPIKSKPAKTGSRKLATVATL
jgi:integrase